MNRYIWSTDNARESFSGPTENVLLVANLGLNVVKIGEALIGF